jgi:hypothetical protein
MVLPKRNIIINYFALLDFFLPLQPATEVTTKGRKKTGIKVDLK